MEKIILPLVTNPPTVAYQNKANYLGILLTDQNYEKELYVDYVNLIWNTQNSSCGFETAAYNHHFRDDCFLYATYIAWSIVGKDDGNGNKIQVNKKYADVNLDGTTDLLDVIAILQSISGHYGTSLLSSNYKLFFDLNGFVCDEVDDSVMVEFYDENGDRNQWSENVDFEKYEQLMNQLGYTFVGWYTRMNCMCEGECTHFIEATKDISYDKYQGVQTLYARWEKNKIVFEMNGANSSPFDEIVFSKPEHENLSVILEKPSWTYDVKYVIDGDSENLVTGRIYKEFLGWQDEQGNILEQIDLSVANLGTKKLTAVWSEYKWQTPDTTKLGYHCIGANEWYWYDNYPTKTIITNINEKDLVERIVAKGGVIYGDRRPIEYTITYQNTQNVKNDNSTKYYVSDNAYTLIDLSDYTGYEFDCWVDENGNEITSIPKGTTGNLVLTAKWKAKVYTVTVQGIDVNPSNQNDANGNPKYNTKDFGVLYYTYGDDSHEQGFYIDIALGNKLPADYFDDYCVDTLGKTNFTFGGLYASLITNNGHSYASYTNTSIVLSAKGEAVSVPSLNESSRAGSLYALIVPKQYTITFDYNISSQQALAVTNTPTQKVSSYYNEFPNKISVMPSSTYYLPLVYSVNGTSYFDSTGKSMTIYNISGNTSMSCQWGKKYSDYTYIYDVTTLNNIRNNLSGKYMIIKDIDCTSITWAVIGSESVPFTGTINGDGHKLSNLSGNTFISNNSGTICNLTLENANITNNSGEVDTVGILTGRNNGVIDNCHIVSSKINRDYSYNSGNLHLDVGGLTAVNTGTISNSSISNTDMKGYARGGKGHYDVYLNMGGIAAHNQTNGKIENCASNYNTLYGYIYHNGIGGFWYDNDRSYAYFRLGGVVGYAENGQITSTTYYNNTVTNGRDYYNHDNVTDSNYAILSEDYKGAGVGKDAISSGCVEKQP